MNKILCPINWEPHHRLFVRFFSPIRKERNFQCTHREDLYYIDTRKILATYDICLEFQQVKGSQFSPDSHFFVSFLATMTECVQSPLTPPPQRRFARRGACVFHTLYESAELVSFFHSTPEAQSSECRSPSSICHSLSRPRKRAHAFGEYPDHGFKRHALIAA